ncbi:HAD-IC family P-type ATPase [Lihuaxuella thermophila]|uniref:ATPase, P-type (Transporting), HAD superfamily, subfamily IC n=1 Tax=Lihuaxuella thermophila TaxID=1173111 RepID=A0A1H8G8S7_9BACL|nr:ATPase, P-type (transporting), HAD superfamily, subfamily IC [Lihuaxuella thermophila]
MRQYKERFIRVCPGRLRTEVHGLEENHRLAEHLTARLLQLPGVQEVKPCTLTGRVAVQYDPGQVDLSLICTFIQQIEEWFIHYKETERDERTHPCQPISPVYEEVAAGKAEPVLESPEQPAPPEFQIPEHFHQVWKPPQGQESSSRIPWGLTLTLGGLTLLGAKQILFGKSAVASSPLLFAASGVLSVVTGYPFLRRGIDQLSEHRKWNADLILGTAAIGLGLMRENLLVLAGLSILQYIHWKRSQLENDEPTLAKMEEQYLSPDIRQYSEKIGKWAFPIAGLTWAVTRDPLRGLAVLLAANPRLVLTPAIAAWKQAETNIVREGGWVPENGTLSQLARTRTILVEDTSQLFHPSTPGLQLLVNEEAEEERVWNLAASLLAKTHHPWRENILAKARQTHRTMRTAFHVEEDEDGVRGDIHQVPYYFGKLAYLQKHGLNVDPFLLKLKRMEKNRTEAYCLVRKSGTESQCLGVIFKENHPPTSAFLSLRKNLEQAGRTIAVLNNSLRLETQELESCGIQTEWLALNPMEQQKQLARLREEGEEFLLLIRQEGSISTSLTGLLPHITAQQWKELPRLLQISDKIGEQVDRQFQATKLFNVAGTVLALPFRVSAMMINLMADALSLVFLSRIRDGQRPMEDPAPSNQAMAEIAAATCLEAEAPLWYTLPPREVAAHFCLDEQTGLTDQQVQALQHQFGYNQLSQPESEPWWKAYLGQFKEFTTLLLLGTTLLAFVSGDIFHGLAMTVVLMLNAAIGTIQERKAEKVVEALNQYQAPLCKVIRNGEEQVISGKELVPGDLVRLESGDRVPADIRLLECWNFEVDKSMLTGESVSVAKTTDSVPAHSSLAERANMVYKGTNVCRGRAVGVVVSTGMRTEMGHLMEMIRDKQKEQTPLQQDVARISKTFIKAALAITLSIFVIGLLRGNSFMQMIPTSIALAASAVPEGLPVTVTIALSAGIFRMAKKSVLIRRLSALETLGRATVICTDKTGTLTKNEMTVRSAATLGHQWAVTGEGYNPEGTLVSEHPVSPGHEEDLKQLAKIALLCNNSKLLHQEGEWSVIGDPTEGALLTFAHKAGISSDETEQWNRMHEVPFDSSTGKMSVVCRKPESMHEEQNCYVLTKGSVESVLENCRFVQSEGKVVPITAEHKRQILKQNEEYAKQALRVLAFAYRPIHWDGNGDGIENDSVYVGMVGMMDPPKAGIGESIREAKQLGVKPVMITGDHPLTAYAIAREIGIDHQPELLTGQELDQLSDEELKARIEQISVFARVTPEHKLRIVRAYQELGHKVAMTGDGVNDTPAIKQADIGIAMGQTGTEVTKETADMVLEQDHFGSIVQGVKEGRTIISNIRKALGCLLTGNLAEIIVTGISVAAGMPLPLIPIQILLMNLLTDALPAMILAVNPGNKTTQTDRIQLADRELYSKVVIRGCLLGLGSLGLFTAILAAGGSLAMAQTVAFATLVSGQLIQTFSWRQEGSAESARDWMKDRFLVGALGVSALALLSTIYLPGVNTFFHTVPLGANHWLKILLVSGTVSMISRPIHRLMTKKKEITSTIQPMNLPEAA